MKAASQYRRESTAHRLMIVDSEKKQITHDRFDKFSQYFDAGDLLVFNDSATLPASLAAHAHEESIEVRLVSREEVSGRWRAVVFGKGSWRENTELRALPPALRAGDRIDFGASLGARVVSVDEEFQRLVTLEFEAPEHLLWRTLYELGRPIQYSYMSSDLEIDQAQNIFSARPWSIENPSAAHAFQWKDLQQLRERGVRMATLTHAAGISSTGSSELDRRLPFDENFEIPLETVQAIEECRGRVIAVGSSVLRALEGNWLLNGGRLKAGAGRTSLRIGPRTELHVAQGFLSGLHSPGTSHHAILEAFVKPELLARADREALERDYLEHEFGDLILIKPGASV